MLYRVDQPIRTLATFFLSLDVVSSLTSLQSTIRTSSLTHRSFRHSFSRSFCKMTTDNNNDNNNENEARNNREIFTLKEVISPGLQFEMQLKQIYTSTRSEFQDIDVVETCFGKTLLTDGLTQSSQFDEFAYHESLVHPALLQCAALRGSSPKTVFIGGGGELATAREVLRHGAVERVVMVDLDAKVVEVCKKYLPEWGGEKVAQDARLDLIIGDAHEYILNTQETFDAIIMDISDPVEAGPGIALYTKEFYEFAVTKLALGGVFVTQAGMGSSIPFFSQINVDDPMCFAPIYNTLDSVFDVTLPYTTSIPSFGSDWGFVMAFNRVEGGKNNEGILMNNNKGMPSTDYIDSLVETYMTGGEASLQHYDGLTHSRMFSLPKPLRKYMTSEKRIMTKDNPIYMFNGN